MKIKAKIDRMVNSGNVKAIASVSLDGMFVVKNLKIMDGKKGLFVSMPQETFPGKDGQKKYSNLFFALTNSAKLELQETVLQAYQQQIGALNSAIPTLYSLALDTYQSGGEELVTRLEQLNGQEQNAQSLYDRQLQDYYTQLQQKGDAYNDAYAKDYGQYQEHLNRLDTLHGYYTAQEQAQASRRQQTFNGIMTVLGVIGDAIQLAISGTTGIGSLAGSLLNTGYNIVSGTRAYEADRADTAWNQQMQEKQRQDSLTQQRYENEASERAYQDALKQQAFNNSVTSEKLNIAKGEWALKQSNAQAKASRAAGNAAAKSRGSGKASGSAAGTNALKGSSVVPFTAALLRSRGKSDTSIANALQKEGYTTSEIAKILQQMNQ